MAIESNQANQNNATNNNNNASGQNNGTGGNNGWGNNGGNKRSRYGIRDYQCPTECEYISILSKTNRPQDQEALQKKADYIVYLFRTKKMTATFLGLFMSKQYEHSEPDDQNDTYKRMRAERRYRICDAKWRGLKSDEQSTRLPQQYRSQRSPQSRNTKIGRNTFQKISGTYKCPDWFQRTKRTNGRHNA
ncbi:Hypothetical_protein [Hexamita inflata]|uniref:Hypothetical_protein n=1 Tax=Hexamita inflata TaxID=28002 RepID=A0AA86Q4X9_9EUKA|nr:Hypothetical protein HINF_LOCUS39846 [Hexamita inflata]